MTKADLLVERGADRLQELARRAAGRRDGVGGWLAEELTADAAFLRKLKPSLVASRARGEAPSEPAAPPKTPAAAQATPPRQEKTKKTKAKKSKTKTKRGGGPAPLLLVVGAAVVAGILVAKLIDWRGHGHPRD